jgi:hypothetical protein
MRRWDARIRRAGSHHAGHADRANRSIHGGNVRDARGAVWGDGTGGTQSYSTPLTLLVPVTITVYGRVPAGQNVAAGSYGDSVALQPSSFDARLIAQRLGDSRLS